MHAQSSHPTNSAGKDLRQHYLILVMAMEYIALMLSRMSCILHDHVHTSLIFAC